MSQSETNSVDSRFRRPASWRRIWPGALVLSLCLFALWFGTRIWPGPLPNRGLTIDASHLDFGELWENSELSKRLSIANAGSSQVEILDWTSSCGCVAVRPRSFKIAPGAIQELAVDVDLRFLVARAESGSEAPPFSIKLIPQIRGSEAEQEGWIVKGRIKRLLRLDRAQVDFGDKLIRGESFPSRRFRVDAAVSLDELTAHTNPSQATVTVVGGPTEFLLEICPCQDLQPGPFQFHILLQPRVSGGKLPSKKLVVEGLVHECVELLPRPVELGIVTVGTNARGHFWVNPRNDQTVEVRPATGGNRQTKILACRPEGRSWRVEFERLIESGGPGSDTGLLDVKLGSQPVRSVPFELRWYGVGAENR